MNRDFLFRSGKYAGKSYGWVKDNNPKYIEWVKENQPKMLVDKPKPTTPKVSKIKDKERGLPFNEEFSSQPPEDISIPFMLKDPDKYGDKIEAFRLANKTQYRKIVESLKDE